MLPLLSLATVVEQAAMKQLPFLLQKRSPQQGDGVISAPSVDGAISAPNVGDDDNSDVDDWLERRPRKFVRNKVSRVAQSPPNKNAALIRPVANTQGRGELGPPEEQDVRYEDADSST